MTITAYNDFGLAPIDPEIADIVDWKRHACRRTCKDSAAPLDCYYTFKLESYHTMSKACYDCPFNITDCFQLHCIPADGMKRSLMVVNRQMPGPPIEVRDIKKQITVGFFLVSLLRFISISSLFNRKTRIFLVNKFVRY